MRRTIERLSDAELTVATVKAERHVGVDSAEAKLFRAEVARRSASHQELAAFVDRARRLATMIECGFTLKDFRAAGFDRATRNLAIELGARREFIRLQSGAFKLTTLSPKV